MILPLLAAAARTGRLGGGGGLDVPVLRILAALLLCLMAATAAILLLRRRAEGGAWLKRLATTPRAIDVVEVRRLGTHADIGLVRHGGAEYLLLLQSGGALVLDTHPAAGEP